MTNAFFSNFRGFCNTSMFNAWETLLNDTEAAASGYTDIAGVLGTTYSPTIVNFHRRILSIGLFTVREKYIIKLNMSTYFLIITVQLQYY